MAKTKKVLRMTCYHNPNPNPDCIADFCLPIKPDQLNALNKILEENIDHIHVMSVGTVKFRYHIKKRNKKEN